MCCPQSNMQQNQHMSVSCYSWSPVFIFSTPSPLCTVTASPTSSLSQRNDIFQDELLYLSAAKSVVCAGFEFQWCTSVPLGRIWLRCRGTMCSTSTSVSVNIPGWAGMSSSDHTNCSHGCLAGWNVLSMVVYVSWDQDSRKMLKCFLLWDTWRPSRPYYCRVNVGGASWLTTHSHLSFPHRWACWGPAEPTSPACLTLSVFCFVLSSSTFSVILPFSPTLLCMHLKPYLI